MVDQNARKALDMIRGKWKFEIIQLLMNRKMRYNEVHFNLNGVSHKVLAEKLAELQKDRIVSKKVYPVIPPKTEYEITSKGMKFKEIIKLLSKVGALTK